MKVARVLARGIRLPLAAISFLLAALCHAQEPAPPVRNGVPTFGTTVVIPGGLRGDIYKIPPRSSMLPNFKKLKPVGSIYTAELNVPPRDFTEGFPGVTDRDEWFAIDYSGTFWIEKPGAYQFALSSDDGSKLYIDDLLVIDNDGIHATWTERGTCDLTFGIHRIRVSYFQGPRYRLSLILSVSPPGSEWRVFSTNEFKPPPDSEDSNAMAALNTLPPPHDFEFHAAVLHFRNRGASWQGALVLEVPAQTKTIHPTLLALLKDASGQIVDRYRRTPPDEAPGPITFIQTFQLAAGHYTVEAAAIDREGKGASTSVIRIDSPQQRPGISLSSVALARLVEPVSGSADGPLVYQGKRVVPWLAPAWNLSEKPSVFFVVYPDRTNLDKPRVQIEFLVNGQLLSTRTIELPSPDASGSIPVLADSAAPPGHCEVRITATQGSDFVRESVHYSVAP
jgi:hypothetical protein